MPHESKINGLGMHDELWAHECIMKHESMNYDTWMKYAIWMTTLNEIRMQNE